MANRDTASDPSNLLKYRRPVQPSVSALRTAIAGSGVSAKYPTKVLDASSKNDLIYICKQEGITVAGL